MTSGGCLELLAPGEMTSGYSLFERENVSNSIYTIN